MTNNDVINILRKYIETQEQEWDFYNMDDSEMAVFHLSECRYSNNLEDIINVLQTVIATLDHVLISEASAQFKFEPEKKEELERYLEECSEEGPIKFYLDYDEEENEYNIFAGLYIDFTKADAEEKLTDEEYLEAIFHWPIEALQEEWQGLEALS